MKKFFLHAYDNNPVQQILNEINICIKNAELCKLWIMCAEEYDFLNIIDYGNREFDIHTFSFRSELVETILVLGALEKKNLKQYKSLGITVYIWKDFWFRKAVSALDTNNITSNKNIEHLFICLNNRPVYHRIKTVQSIIAKDLTDYGFVTWHADLKLLSLSKNKEKKINSTLPSEASYFWSQSNLPTEFNSCLINVVTESTTNSGVIDISEKTVHAIAAGMPFLVIGCQGIHKKLEKMGFLLFHDLFDYSFDSYKQEDDRIESVIKQLKQLQKYSRNYNDLYRQVKPLIDHNKNKLAEIVNNDLAIPWYARDYKIYREYVCEKAKENINFIL